MILYKREWRENQTTSFGKSVRNCSLARKHFKTSAEGARTAVPGRGTQIPCDSNRSGHATSIIKTGMYRTLVIRSTKEYNKLFAPFTEILASLVPIFQDKIDIVRLEGE